MGLGNSGEFFLTDVIPEKYPKKNGEMTGGKRQFRVINLAYKLL